MLVNVEAAAMLLDGKFSDGSMHRPTQAAIGAVAKAGAPLPQLPVLQPPGVPGAPSASAGAASAGAASAGPAAAIAGDASQTAASTPGPHGFQLAGVGNLQDAPPAVLAALGIKKLKKTPKSKLAKEATAKEAGKDGEGTGTTEDDKGAGTVLNAKLPCVQAKTLQDGVSTIVGTLHEWALRLKHQKSMASLLQEVTDMKKLYEDDYETIQTMLSPQNKANLTTEEVEELATKIK